MLQIIFAIIVLLLPVTSFAVDKIYQPNVEKGVMNLEVSAEEKDENGLVLIDNYTDVQTDLRYGFTDNIAFGLEVNADNGNSINDDNFGYRVTGFENYLQFSEQHDNEGLATGLRTEYELNHSGPDKISTALLFDYVGNKFQYLINAGVYSEIGDDADQDLTGDIKVGVRYLLDDMLQPGIEYYTDTGELDELNDFADQTQVIGPVVYGALTNEFYYEAGYLYGMTDRAPDNSFKAMVGYKVNLGN